MLSSVTTVQFPYWTALTVVAAVFAAFALASALVLGGVKLLTTRLHAAGQLSAEEKASRDRHPAARISRDELPSRPCPAETAGPDTGPQGDVAAPPTGAPAHLAEVALLDLEESASETLAVCVLLDDLADRCVPLVSAHSGELVFTDGTIVQVDGTGRGMGTLPSWLGAGTSDVYLSDWDYDEESALWVLFVSSDTHHILTVTAHTISV